MTNVIFCAESVFYSPAAAEATGMRGLPPATFIMSPEDVIVARVRDIDDKVKKKEGKRREVLVVVS